MKAIAIDDESIALEIIRNHAEKVPFLDLRATFTNAFDAIAFLQRERADLLFLDIQMPDISGIDLLHSLGTRPMVIFTTAYPDYAVTGYELDAVDYLMKPFSFPRFLKSCNKALELYNARSPGNAAPADHVFVRTASEHVKVLFSELLYVEADGNYVTFVLNGRNVVSRCTFQEAMAQLPADKFIRVHRSYMISVARVEKTERHQVTVGGQKIPVSEGFAESLKRLG